MSRSSHRGVFCKHRQQCHVMLYLQAILTAKNMENSMETSQGIPRVRVVRQVPQCAFLIKYQHDIRANNHRSEFSVFSPDFIPFLVLEILDEHRRLTPLNV